ncbi:hypothetical protein DXG01_001642 [Tephrocybe rancida]|nr:hypothetical protein DXG01_001642 [Tephrocybe rancida]
MARLPTVYDFSSLQLHPDGSRVRQSTSNLKPRYAAAAVQDSRGNWFARDAAGLGTVGRYRKVRKESEKDEAEAETNPDDAEYSPPGRKDKGKAKETTGRRHNPRPAKRRKFLQDFDFLAPGPSNATSPQGEQPLPSSDLLKSIHYFASTYYHERGQLFNATKEYRQLRRQNKLKRLKRAELDGGDSEELDESSEPMKLPRRGGRRKGVKKTVYPKDMYKTLDGSALMVIGQGMLMQEYVARILEARIPDGWEDMMREAYAVQEDETEGIEDDENNDNNEEDTDAEETDNTSGEDEDEEDEGFGEGKKKGTQQDDSDADDDDDD